jgi:hypothetical protein
MPSLILLKFSLVTAPPQPDKHTQINARLSSLPETRNILEETMAHHPRE